MLWNLTALWSFSSTAWHLFKVQPALFAFQIPSPLSFRTALPLFPASLVHFFSRTRALEMASKRCHRPAALLSPPPLRGAGGGHRAPWRPRPGGAPFEGEARGRRSPCCGGGRLLTNPGPAVTQASPPVNLPAALTGAWRPFKPLRASRRAALPYEVFHNNNSC